MLRLSSEKEELQVPDKCLNTSHVKVKLGAVADRLIELFEFKYISC